jgi:hypothetical protein
MQHHASVTRVWSRTEAQDNGVHDPSMVRHVSHEKAASLVGTVLTATKEHRRLSVYNVMYMFKRSKTWCASLARTMELECDQGVAREGPPALWPIGSSVGARVGWNHVHGRPGDRDVGAGSSVGARVGWNHVHGRPGDRDVGAGAPILLNGDIGAGPGLTGAPKAPARRRLSGKSIKAYKRTFASCAALMAMVCRVHRQPSQALGVQLVLALLRGYHGPQAAPW